jgi:enterochelin esterase-like enzyme
MSAFTTGAEIVGLMTSTAEQDDFRNGIRGAAEALRKAGVRLEYFESSGTAHEWQTWRRDLNDFAPRLFR